MKMMKWSDLCYIKYPKIGGSSCVVYSSKPLDRAFTAYKKLMRQRVKEMKKVQRSRHRFVLKILGVQDRKL